MKGKFNCLDQQSPTGNIPRFVYLLALCLIILGSKFWLIDRYGTDLPIWDPWSGVAGSIFLPYFNGTLAFADLVYPHNEHRIFFTRVICLGIMLLNRQWDARLEMVFNSFLHLATAIFIFWWAYRLGGARFLPLIFLVLILTHASPASWQNILFGFQSQFYLLILSSLLTLSLLIEKTPFSPGWLAGIILAVASLFTMASGVLAACAAAATLSLRILKTRPAWKQDAISLIACLGVIIIGGWLQAGIGVHNILRAGSFSQFMVMTGKNLAWPWIHYAGLAFIAYLPFLALVWFYFRSQEKDLKPVELTLALGFWVILQAVLLAFARCTASQGPPSRYMDLLSLGLVVNLLSIIILSVHYAKNISTAKLWPVIFAGWLLFNGWGAITLALEPLATELPHFKKQVDQYVSHNVRAFLATDDLKYFLNKEYGETPYPDAGGLAYLLRERQIRTILPTSVRSALPVRQAEAAVSPFVTNGIAPGTPEPDEFETCWGSYSAEGGGAEGSFFSLPVSRSTLPILKFDLAGDLGQGYLEMKITDLTDNSVQFIQPIQPTLSAWKPYFIRAPKGPFTITAVDDHHQHWFAFKEPKEMGNLSWLALVLTSQGARILRLGVILGAFVIIYTFCVDSACRNTNTA